MLRDRDRRVPGAFLALSSGGACTKMWSAKDVLTEPTGTNDEKMGFSAAAPRGARDLRVDRPRHGPGPRSSRRSGGSTRGVSPCSRFSPCSSSGYGGTGGGSSCGSSGSPTRGGGARSSGRSGFSPPSITPGKVGDAVRALYVSRETGRGLGESFLTVFMDRLMDLVDGSRLRSSDDPRLFVPVYRHAVVSG